MRDEKIDEISARMRDGKTQLKWKYADGPYHYRWFDFQR